MNERDLTSKIVQFCTEVSFSNSWWYLNVQTGNFDRLHDLSLLYKWTD